MTETFAIGEDLKQILNGWETHERKRLNVFRLVSDIYYRENFHSDIIKTLLDPQTHLDSITLFLDFLNRVKPALKINPDHYDDAEVMREPGRIDILIQSSTSKHCVIFENKINDAVDQDGQLSSYLFKAKRRWPYVDAVVYLSKDGTKKPSEATFDTLNRDQVEKLLIQIAAYAHREDDLVHGWLGPLRKASPQGELAFLIDHYIDILTEIGEHTMNGETKIKFLQWLREEGNYAQTKRLVELFNSRIHMVLDHLAERYNEKDLKEKYSIQSAKVSYYRGWMLAIDAKLDCGIIRVEVCEILDAIRLMTYPLPPTDEKARLFHDSLRGEIKVIIDANEDGQRQFRWPKEEEDLGKSIVKVLDLLRSKNHAN